MAEKIFRKMILRKFVSGLNDQRDYNNSVSNDLVDRFCR